MRLNAKNSMGQMKPFSAYTLSFLMMTAEIVIETVIRLSTM
jgi:hypothetical protein